MTGLAIEFAHGFAHGWPAALSQVATGSLVNAVWQGVLLAAAAGLGLRLLPKTPAAVRFAIWFGVFLVVAALPVFSLWPHAASATGGHAAWITLNERWCLAIAAAWAMASLVRAVTLVVAAFRVRALWKRARPVEALYRTHRDECAMNGAPGSPAVRRVKICTSDEIDRPTVIGFFAPKILIPEWLLEKLSPAELEQIVLHECGHLGRADDWMNLVQKIALVVFPLNPALAWVERRLCFERELAVDERVLQATGAPKAYAACLASLAEHRLQRRGLALALGALGRESELGRRVGRILRRGEHMKPMHARLVLGGAMLGLLVGATGLAHCPQVVGFSAANRVEAVNVVPPIRNAELAGGFTAQPVTLRLDAPGSQPWSAVGDGQQASHKLLLMKHVARNADAKDQDQNGEVRAADVSMKAPELRTDPVPQTVQTAAIADPQDDDVVIAQWTVVTSLGNGSRVVLTQQRVLNRAPRVEQDVDAPPAGRMRPYTVVPVQGGWLVIQL